MMKSRLQDKAALSQEEKEKLAWAEQRIEQAREQALDGVDGRICEQGGGDARVPLRTFR